MGELIGKKELVKCIRMLNAHYGKKVKFRTGYPTNGENSPVADMKQIILIFPPVEGFYDKHVLAHEYSHILTAPTYGQLMARFNFTEKDWHNNKFRRAYEEVCLVLGVFAINHDELIKIVRSRPDCGKHTSHHNKALARRC